MNNIIKRILCTVLALTMLASLAACGRTEEQPEGGQTGTSQSETFVPVSIIAAPVEKQEYDDNGTLILEYSLDAVEFTGGGIGASAEMTRTYNEIFTIPAQEYIAGEIEYLRDGDNYFPEDAPNSYYSQSAGVLRSDETLFVLSVESGQYSSGAAHGNYACEALCFDPADGKVVTLNDIGVNGADPTGDIARLLAEKYMSEHEDEGYISDFDDAVETIGIMLSGDYHKWYISDEFVLISSPYDLAPYAAGVFEVTLSPADLEGIVDAKWFAEPAPEPNTRIFTGESDFDEFSMVYVVGDYGYEKNLVWFDCDVTNAYLTEVEYAEDGGFIGTTTLDAFAELKAGEALLLDIMVPEGMPNTALTAEIDGQSYTWLIGYNGRDGGLSFMEEELQPAG